MTRAAQLPLKLGEAKPPRMTTADLTSRLRRHYIKPGETFPGGIFLTEVQDPSGGRRVDALHYGFVGSRGRYLTGHEVKVTRADWQRELDDPHKADYWFRHTHRWYVVAPDTDIVRPAELPDGWGLLVVNPRTTTRLDVAVKAPVREDATVSWPLMLEVLKAADTERAHLVAEARDRAQQAATAQVEERVAAHLAQRTGYADARAEHAIAVLLAVERAVGRRVASPDAPAYRGITDQEIPLDALTGMLAQVKDAADLAAQTADLLRWTLPGLRNNLAGTLRHLDEAIDALPAATGGRPMPGRDTT